MSKFEHAWVSMHDPGADKPIYEGAWTQCGHCAKSFPLPRFDNLPGSKASRIGRGYCPLCNAYICGASCVDCNGGWEKQLEIMEGTRNPTAVSVPVLWTPQSA